MSAFFVGQRVRVNCPISEQHGAETVVARVGVIGIDSGHRFTNGVEVAIALGAWGFPNYVFEPHELEPILPEGMKPARWEDCIWQPEGVTA